MKQKQTKNARTTYQLPPCRPDCLPACQSDVAATKNVNFDAATRLRLDCDSIRFDSIRNVPQCTTSQRSGVLLCVCAHCRCLLPKLNSAHTAHTHHTRFALFAFVALSLLGTGSAAAAVAAAATNHPCVLRARLHAGDNAVSCGVCRSLACSRALACAGSLSTQQMAALSADLCLYVYLACARTTSAVLRAWCCRRCRCRCRRRQSARSVC